MLRLLSRCFAVAFACAFAVGCEGQSSGKRETGGSSAGGASGRRSSGGVSGRGGATTGRGGAIATGTGGAAGAGGSFDAVADAGPITGIETRPIVVGSKLALLGHGAQIFAAPP